MAVTEIVYVYGHTENAKMAQLVFHLVLSKIDSRMPNSKGKNNFGQFWHNGLGNFPYRLYHMVNIPASD